MIPAPTDPVTPLRHVPVMASEVLRELITDTSGIYIDATIGNAGHAELVMERLTKTGRLVGLDRDREAVEISQARLKRFGTCVTVLHRDYRHLGEVCQELGIRQITGALIDLGLSSIQLDQAARGFSYQQDGPLDLRFDTSQGTPAAEWLKTATEDAITTVLQQYGEEPHARKIARMILATRRNNPLTTTSQLRRIIIDAVGPRSAVWGRTAARVLQAIRIQVNSELDAVPAGLESAIDLLVGNGRLVVLTYHSVEDRLVKSYFREASRRCTCPPVFPHCVCGAHPRGREVHRRVLRPSAEEMSSNPRSRAAKMRVFEKSASIPAKEND